MVNSSQLLLNSVSPIKYIQILLILYQPEMFAQVLEGPFALGPFSEITEHFRDRYVRRRTHMVFPFETAFGKQVFHLLWFDEHFPYMQVGWHKSPALPFLPDLNGHQFADKGAIERIIEKYAAGFEYP